MRRRKTHLDRYHCSKVAAREEKRQAAFEQVANATVYEDDLAGKVSLRAYLAQFEGPLNDNLEIAVENLLLGYERRYDLPKARKELTTALEATRGHSVLRSEEHVLQAAKAINQALNRRWYSGSMTER